MEKQCQNAQLVRHASQNVFSNIKPLLILTFYSATLNIHYKKQLWFIVFFIWFIVLIHSILISILIFEHVTYVESEKEKEREYVFKVLVIIFGYNTLFYIHYLIYII